MSKEHAPVPRSAFGLLEQAIGTEFVHVIHSWIADITAPQDESAESQPDKAL